MLDERMCEIRSSPGIKNQVNNYNDDNYNNNNDEYNNNSINDNNNDNNIMIIMLKMMIMILMTIVMIIMMVSIFTIPGCKVPEQNGSKSSQNNRKHRPWRRPSHQRP